MNSDSLLAQQTGSNQSYPFQGFVPTGNTTPTTFQQVPRFGGSSDFSAHSGGLNLPEALASIPTWPTPENNASFNPANPSLGLTLDQRTSSRMATQSAETTSLASASSTTIGTREHGRRPRGEVRRGQPKPRGWTEEEVGILMRMYAERNINQPVSEVTRRIAETLGKSTGAVEAKYWRLRGGDPKASKNRRGGCGGGRGGRVGRNGRGGIRRRWWCWASRMNVRTMRPRMV